VDWVTRYRHWLWGGRSGDRIPLGARFSAPVQTDPGAHSASCTMSTGSFPGVKSGRGVTLTPHPLLVPWLLKGRATPLLPLRAIRPVQNFQCLYKGTLYLFLYYTEKKGGTNLFEQGTKFYSPCTNKYAIN
jgi:hypothetical protein